jgi:hypothetical protein
MNPTDPIPATLDGIGRELAAIADRLDRLCSSPLLSRPTRATLQMHAAHLQDAGTVMESAAVRAVQVGDRHAV